MNGEMSKKLTVPSKLTSPSNSVSGTIPLARVTVEIVISPGADETDTMPKKKLKLVPPCALLFAQRLPANRQTQERKKTKPPRRGLGLQLSLLLN